jgi:hypothetical protein
MTGFRAFALGLAVAGVFGPTAADAAPRRGGVYWWWAREAATPEAAPQVTLAAPAPAPAPVAVPAPALAPIVVPAPVPSAPLVTTASLFGGNAPAAVGLVSSGYIPGPSATAASNYYAPASPTSYDYDAFINFTDGPFAQSASLTTGGARAWYESPVVRELYGGTPNAQQQADFTSTVLQRVDQTFRDSGVAVSLTTDPGASAAHTLSVVSNTSYAQNPDAIGITDMGNDGFSFIDKLSYARNVDQLQWAVAHNVAHELMHAFNVEHHDKTGQFLDAAVASWDTLIDPATVFGPEAVQDLLSQNFRSRFTPAGVFGAQGLEHATGTLLIAPSPVPEPTTWLAWGLAVAPAIVYRSRRARRTRAA